MVLIFPLELGRPDADSELSALFTVPHLLSAGGSSRIWALSFCVEVIS